jgi:hypothetical protein
MKAHRAAESARQREALTEFSNRRLRPNYPVAGKATVDVSIGRPLARVERTYEWPPWALGEWRLLARVLPERSAYVARNIP